MSGHSKWASIKHKKALVDAKRGKVFTKLIRELTVAARAGGGNPDNNPRLRVAIESARAANMPSDNIERAVKKGTGGLEGQSIEEVVYEGYGPGGVALYVQCLSDNKNRTASEIRNIFGKKGGNMAGAGSVAWLFEKKGLIVVDGAQVTEDQVLGIVLDAGAEDMKQEGDAFVVTTGPQELEAIRQALLAQKVSVRSADITMIPKSQAPVGPAEAKAVLALIDALEEHDDVQNVYANFEIPDELMKEIA